MARPSRSHVRRPEVLDAAVEELRARGYDGVRLSDVADRLGVTKAMPLHYWRTKDELLEDALVHADARAQDELAAELEGLGPPAERLRHVLARSAQAETATAEWSLWIELWSRSLRSPRLREAHAGLERRYRDVLAAIVRDGRASGAFPTGDPDDVALVLSALMDGVAVAVVLGDPRFDAASTERLLRTTAEGLLGTTL